MEILISIKPKYVKKIFDGTKKWEFRKSIPNKEIHHAYIYSSYPIKRVVGEMELGRVVKGTPEYLWNYCKNPGISKEDFFEYFKNSNIGYAYNIEDVIEYNKEEYINLNINNALVDMNDKMLQKRIIMPLKAPQSWCYLHKFNEFADKMFGEN